VDVVGGGVPRVCGRGLWATAKRAKCRRVTAAALRQCGSRYLGTRVVLVGICAAEGERLVLGNEEV
jgi:hypothetical protein